MGGCVPNLFRAAAEAQWIPSLHRFVLKFSGKRDYTSFRWSISVLFVTQMIEIVTQCYICLLKVQFADEE